MSRMKSVFAAALLVAVASIVPQAHAVTNAATIKLMVAGSSAMWQAMGLGAFAYNGTGGNCPSGAIKPCFHYTQTFSLTDTRPKTFGGKSTNSVDAGGTWIVWDSHTTTSGGSVFSTPNVWAYTKVDTAVGDRCYFAHPRCFVNVASWPASPSGSISSTLWGPDTDPNNCGGTCNGAGVVATFISSAGVLVQATATDVRPEDALWATCRVNSGLETAHALGLGYNPAIPAGQCQTTATAKTDLTGTDIVSQIKTSNTAHVAAWNLTGTDPYSGIAIPAATTIPVGIEPLIIVDSLGGGGSLNTVNNVTDEQLQQVFSGANCDAKALGASTNDSLNVYIREPLSGTMNSIEYTVFAYPDFSGKSQELGVGDPTLAGNNPLNKNCALGGKRERGIGTGDIISQIWADGTNNNVDSIGYAFFSYGNVTNGTKSITDNAKFRYLTLNGVEPIWHVHPDGSGSAGVTDPGENNASVGVLSAAGDLPASCGNAFPCGEDKIWSGGGSVGTSNYGVSFPNVRSGQYRAWSLLRFVSDGAALATAKTLITQAQTIAASTTPDFIPFNPILPKPTANPPVPGDPGVSLLRSHYQEVDTNGVHLGPTPQNDGVVSGAEFDKGGDVGGCILHLTPGITTATIAQSDSTTGLTQTLPGSGTGCVVFSAH